MFGRSPGGLLLAAICLLVLVACGEDDLIGPDDRPFQTMSVPVTVDARIASDLYNFNYGLSEYLMVGKIVYAGAPTVVNRTLVSLPDIDIGLDTLDIGAIFLVLTDTSGADSSQYPVTMAQADSLWEETTVTWLTAPSAIAPPMQSKYVLNGELRFNVVPFYVDSTYREGVVLSTEAVRTWFYSSEAADSTVRPRVIVFYRTH